MLVKELRNYPDTPKVLLPTSNGPPVIISPEDYDFLKCFTWRWKKSFNCFYIVTSWRYKNRVHTIQMHRLIAQTPMNMVCHHINHKTGDNRRDNLRNMLEFDHVKFHSWR